MPERVTFARIAVGYGGGDGARDALALARLLARGETALTLIRVLVRHELLEEVAPEAVQRVAKERREKLAAETRAAANEVRADAVTVLADSPAAGLERATAELDAALLVVGSSARVRAGQILPAVSPCASCTGRRFRSRCPRRLSPARGSPAARRRRLRRLPRCRGCARAGCPARPGARCCG
jgi:nucleotide-binding universal stress UspA family protein